jgi:hypothetical protein
VTRGSEHAGHPVWWDPGGASVARKGRRRG